MASLVLASASPARARTLRDAHISHSVQVSNVDEDALVAQASTPLSPADQALLLAQAKARNVAHSLSGEQIVLGCDSLFELDGVVYGKPHTTDVARTRIKAMRGTTGILHTGHWIVDGDKEVGKVCSVAVHFADITDEEIEAYLATGEPLEVAGSFTIDGYGGPFISGVDGDHHSVVGLSLPTLRVMLSELGRSITQFWE